MTSSTAARLIAVLAAVFCVSINSQGSRAAWLTGWDYRQEIVVAPSMTPADLTDFPLLVKITDPTDHVFTQASASGQDIVFTAADGVTPLDREIEHYSNTGTNELDAWVKTAVSASSPTKLYMYYKGSPVANAPSVWDPNFQMVQHLQENPVGTQPTMRNSAGNVNHGTNVGLGSGDQMPGQIDGSLDFASTSAYVDCGTDASLKMGTSHWTAEAWINTTSTAIYNGVLNTWSGGGGAESYRLMVNGHASVGGVPEKASFVIYDGAARFHATSTTSVNDGDWHHVAGVRDATGVTVYVDGNPEDSMAMGPTVDIENTASLKVGRGFSGGWLFDGQIDEVRISNTDRSADWLKASFNNQSDAAQVSSGGFQTDAPWLNGYLFRQAICISKEAVTADQTDFPLPVQIDDPENKVFSQTNSAQGHDVVFTTADGTTLLTHEVERYNKASGSEELCAWVKTSLSASQDTEIYMYYGGPDSSDPYSTGVWDPNYKIVQHLQEDPTGQLKDSTNYANHGTANGMTGADQVSGKVDGSLSFDGSNDWVNFGSASSLDTPGDFTIEMWVHNEAGGSSYPTLLNRAGQSTTNGYFWIYTTGTNEADLNFQYAYDDGVTHGRSTEVFSSALGEGGWNHVVFVYKDSSEGLTLYVDGLPVGGTRTLVDGLPVDDGTLYLGTYRGSSASSYPFAGGLDEFRLSDTYRDLDWIRTGYNLMNPEPGFLTMGAVEWVPEPTSLLLLALGGLALIGRRRKRIRS